MSKLAKWQEEYVEQIEAMSNAELLDEVLDQSHGDSWDGAFTKNGNWRYNCVELHLRMRLIDWLNEEKGEK